MTLRRQTFLALPAAVTLTALTTVPALAEPLDAPTPYFLTSSSIDIKSWHHASWHGECASGYYVKGQLDTYSTRPCVWINGADDISLSDASGTDSFDGPTGIQFQSLDVKVRNSDLIHSHEASIQWQCVPVGTVVAADLTPDALFDSSS